ncbi:hypothetical protein SAMN05660964_00287 [Thiothrix caldifontis]|jgi:hypothetical protein|uniref:Uncharacterized protein n=1 Tax=Thiothrix caldifontis TaxID=525918 RepID=A0A1H3VWH4_9GAMM|nr:hypothetical protein [Thiothrix caldifontis]SDZ79041.1 hypothetical protein SAMN05660964_00287 [Thiothrix caldifontis]
MGTRIHVIVAGSIFAGIGLFWVLGTAIESFGVYQTLASIVLTLALGMFYRIGYSDGKHACYMNAKPDQSHALQRHEPRIQD